jgi:hypothetical protein
MDFKPISKTMLRSYGQKFIGNDTRKEVSRKQETRDAILWDVLPATKQARVKIQGSNTLVIAHYPENWQQTPFWLKPGMAVKIVHNAGSRGRIELVGMGQVVPTAVSGPTFPALANAIDAILSNIKILPIPNDNQMRVMITTGVFREQGTKYTLPEITTADGDNFFAGMGGLAGQVARIVDIAAAPSAGNFRIDIIVVGTDLVVDYIQGAASPNPIQPDTPANHVFIGKILLNSSTVAITFNEINRRFRIPRPTIIEISHSDQFLAWTELTDTVTITIKDQYGLAVTRTVSGGWYIIAKFVFGNGTISSVEEGDSTTQIGQHTGESSNTATFTYTRDQVDPGDISPTLTFTLETNFPIAKQDYILLSDVSGNPMGGQGSI